MFQACGILQVLHGSLLNSNSDWNVKSERSGSGTIGAHQRATTHVQGQAGVKRTHQEMYMNIEQRKQTTNKHEATTKTD